MIGIDKHIEILRQIFEDNLWVATGAVFYGRCFRNERNEGLIPEVSEGTDYREVLLNDNNSSTSFFDVEPSRTATIENTSTITANVSVYFGVNLEDLYSGLSRNEQTESAYKDVIALVQASPFKFTGFETGFSSYSTWAYDKADIDNMQPYHLFRIDTTINYNLNC